MLSTLVLSLLPNNHFVDLHNIKMYNSLMKKPIILFLILSFIIPIIIGTSFLIASSGSVDHDSDLSDTAFFVIFCILPIAMIFILGMFLWKANAYGLSKTYTILGFITLILVMIASFVGMIMYNQNEDLDPNDALLFIKNQVIV